MKRFPRRAVLLVSSAVMTAFIANAALAADGFPSKPIRFIVPYAAGGGPDITTRKITQTMGSKMKATFIVEARPGGNGTIGSTFVARSAPDGHTVLYGSSSTLSAVKAVLKDPPYDPVRDFSGITIFQEVAFILLARPDEKNTSFAQLMEKIRKNPEQYPAGAAFVTAQIIHNLISEAGNLKHTYVPYTLAPAALNDLMGGRLGLGISSINVIRPLIESGKLHPVVVTAPKRLGILPNVPTIAETFPDFTIQNVNGYFVPSKTPRSTVSFLNQKMIEALRDPELTKWNESAGRAVFLTPEEADNVIKRDEVRLLPMYRKAGIKPE